MSAIFLQNLLTENFAKPHKRKLMRREVQRAKPFVQGYRECNFPVQVKGGSHCPVEVMPASLHTGYCLTLESAGLAAKLPFSQAPLWEKMKGNACPLRAGGAGISRWRDTGKKGEDCDDLLLFVGIFRF